MMLMDAVEIIGLTKYYNGFKALDGVSFRVKYGEIFGLLGPNGAGKTTLLRILAGILEESEGTVRIDRYNPRSIEAKRLTGYCPQESIVYDDHTALENLMFYASLYDIPGGEARKRAMRLLKLVGLDDKADVRVGKFSGGMKKRLNLAVSLVNEPKVVILDEPTTGLDPAIRRELWDLIKGLKDEGRAILIATHYMEEAEYLCDRVAIMDRGRIASLGTPDELKRRIGDLSVIELRVSKWSEGLLEALKQYSEEKPLAEDNVIRLYTRNPDPILPRVMESVIGSGSRVSSVSIVEPTLEDVFIKLTGRRLRE